jgi:hypothetical protein
MESRTEEEDRLESEPLRLRLLDFSTRRCRARPMSSGRSPGRKPEGRPTSNDAEYLQCERLCENLAVTLDGTVVDFVAEKTTGFNDSERLRIESKGLPREFAGWSTWFPNQELVC